MKVKHGLRMCLLLSLAIFWATPSAEADTVNVFAISGTGYHNCFDPLGEPIPGCTPTTSGFAGALEVDATTGTPIEMAGLGPGIGFFGSLLGGFFSSPAVIPYGAPTSPNGTCLTQGEEVIQEYLILCFTTPTPGSLAGFEGGTILGLPTVDTGLFDNSNYQYFFITGGSVTLVAAPEPSVFALMLLGVGLLALAVSSHRRSSGVANG